MASSLTDNPETLNQIGAITVVFLSEDFSNNNRMGFDIKGYIKSMELLPEDELKIASP